MADNELKAMASGGGGQEAPALTDELRARAEPQLVADVEEVRRREGLASAAEAIRVVLGCWVRFEAVRRAVRQARAQMVLQPEGGHEDGGGGESARLASGQ